MADGPSNWMFFHCAVKLNRRAAAAVRRLEEATDVCRVQSAPLAMALGRVALVEGQRAAGVADAADRQILYSIVAGSASVRRSES